MAGGAKAITKARLEGPVQTPLCFNEQPVIESRIFPLELEALRELKECIRHSGGVSGRGQVAGVVVTAIDQDALVAMDTVIVLVTYSVKARNYCSTALAVHEVDSLDDAFAPGIVANSKGTGGCIPRAKQIVSRLLDFRKIENLIAAKFGFLLLHWSRQDDLSRIRVDE